MANKRSVVHSNVALIVIKAILNTALLSVIERHARVLTLRCAANRNKSRLIFSSAEMFKKPLWQTVWTQIRLLLSYRSSLFLVHAVCFFT